MSRWLYGVWQKLYSNTKWTNSLIPLPNKSPRWQFLYLLPSPSLPNTAIQISTTSNAGAETNNYMCRAFRLMKALRCGEDLHHYAQPPKNVPSLDPFHHYVQA